MKKDIRAKLIRAGLVFSTPAAARTAPADSSFVDLCVEQIFEGKSLSVKDLAKMFEKSPDWVLKNFKDVAGMFRQGKVIRYPEEAVKAKIRSLLYL